MLSLAHHVLHDTLEGRAHPGQVDSLSQGWYTKSTETSKPGKHKRKQRKASCLKMKCEILKNKQIWNSLESLSMPVASLTAPRSLWQHVDKSRAWQVSFAGHDCTTLLPVMAAEARMVILWSVCPCVCVGVCVRTRASDAQMFLLCVFVYTLPIYDIPLWALWVSSIDV